MQVTGQSAGQSALEHVFRNFNDYVEGKEKNALRVELIARTEEATILRDQSVDELCSNLALSVVDQSLDRSEHERTKRVARDLKTTLAVRTRELEASIIAREEMQQQAWHAQIRGIVTETVLVAACVGQAQLEAAEANRVAQVTFPMTVCTTKLQARNALSGQARCCCWPAQDSAGRRN